jgi:hypothetical protein
MEIVMLIVRIVGGLGNQMFQYAFYLALTSKGHRTLIDVSYYDSNLSHNGYEIEALFNVKPEHATTEQILNLSHLKITLYEKIRRKVLPFKSHYIEKKYNYDYNYPKISKLIKRSNLYLDGYWEDSRYFRGCSFEVRKAFVFRPITDNNNIEILRTIINRNSVSVHIRRGDKLNSKIHTILDERYYLTAFEMIKTRIQNPVFIFFSDDLKWTSNFVTDQNLDFIIVDWNRKENSYIDMQLMSECKHNVIANSSFSWWGAYLNDYHNKIVIAPAYIFKKKYRHLENDGFIPKEWIRI